MIAGEDILERLELESRPQHGERAKWLGGWRMVARGGIRKCLQVHVGLLAGEYMIFWSGWSMRAQRKFIGRNSQPGMDMC